MITFNELSSRIANILGKQNDHAIRERAKAAFKDVFAARIRQSVEKNGIDSVNLITIQVPLVVDTETTMRDFVIYKTSVPVPTPTRIKNDAPFMYVGINKPTDDNVPAHYKTEMEIRASFKTKLKGLVRYYTFEGSVIKLFVKSKFGNYSLDVSNIKSVNLKSIYEDLEQVANLYTDFAEDYPIPYPRDMVESILQEILKTEFNYNVQDKEVKA